MIIVTKYALEGWAWSCYIWGPYGQCHLLREGEEDRKGEGRAAGQKERRGGGRAWREGSGEVQRCGQ